MQSKPRSSPRVLTPPAGTLGRVRDRFALDHDYHGLRWHLQLPREGEPVARPLLITLGLPTFGLAFAISVLTTYGPVVLIRLTDSPSQVGVLIGAEGAFALVVPVLAGALSDRLPGSPATRRLPFILAGAPLAVAGLVLLPFSGTVGLAAAGVLAFFVGYYLYYPPYRALYVDLLPRSSYARMQANQAVLRGVGLGAALLTGGLLLSAWRPLPFLIAAAALIATTAALAPVFRLESDCSSRVLPYETVSLRKLLLEGGPLRRVILANTCWEFSFAGLKSFIVLYLVRGLGRSPSLASAAIAVVAVAVVVGAPLAGRLADRHGIVPVLRVATLLYGVGLMVGTFFHTLTPLLIGLPFVALAGAVVMTLPQALVFSLSPLGSAGAAAGLVDFTRGIGVVLGPVVVGAAIEAFQGEFASTHGYAVLWPVIAIPVLLSFFILRTLPADAASEAA